MLNIGIDGKRFYKNSSGLGRYSRSLINSLLPLVSNSELSFTLFKPKGRAYYTAPKHNNLKIVKVSSILPGNLGNAIWRFQHLPYILDEENYSLFHGLSHVVPLRGKCPKIVTMFDLIFLRYPHYFPLWDRNYYDYAFRRSARLANHIISISKSTKEDLISFYKIPEQKISVIYPAFDDSLEAVSTDIQREVRKKFNLPEKYVLFVGTIEPRKNILRLAKAFDQLQYNNNIDDTVQLLIVGKKGWFYKDIFSGIAKLQSTDKIHFLGPAYGKELAAIYQQAIVMVYPSLFEGFGYPVLEAMRLKTPVITSNVSSLPEVSGNAACLVEPRKLDSIMEGLKLVLNDEEYRKQLINKGELHAQNFTSEKMAKKTLDLYYKFAR